MFHYTISVRSNTNVSYNPREPVLPGGCRYIMDHDPKQSQLPFENVRPLGYFLTERSEPTSMEYQKKKSMKDKTLFENINK